MSPRRSVRAVPRARTPSYPFREEHLPYTGLLSNDTPSRLSVAAKLHALVAPNGLRRPFDRPGRGIVPSAGRA